MNKLLLLFLLFAVQAYAHDIHYSVAQEKAYMVQVYYADGTKFSYESYEVYKPSDHKVAYMVGRTDAEGRVLFVPNEAGKWLIKVFSDDGHGANIELNVDSSMKMFEKKLDFFEKYARASFGLGILMLIFSIITIYARRKR
jgi:nickel transport protein